MRSSLLFLVTILCFFTCTSTESQEKAPISEVKEKIIIQNYYWAKEGKIEEVYQHRLYASQVRKELGLAVGRVLKRTDAEGELPNVIWECEYESEEARQEDLRKLENTGKFEPVMEKMSTLIDKFDRGMYKVEVE